MLETRSLFSVALGLIGGAALIATNVTARRGQAIFLPYAAVLILAGLYNRRHRIQSLWHAFGTIFGATMVATAILYAATVLLLSPYSHLISLAGHAWRIGLAMLIMAAASLVVALLARIRLAPAEV